MKPSSTQVLQPFINYNMIPEDVLSAAALRGEQVHLVCAALAKGLIVPVLPPEYDGYVISFQKWLEIAVKSVIFSEIELYCPCYDYVGHPDLACVLRGDLGITIVDLKTPATESRAWRAQIASYWHLVQEHGGFDLPVIRSGSLMLDRGGKMAKLKEYTKFNATDFNGFIAALSAWRWFNG